MKKEIIQSVGEAPRGLAANEVGAVVAGVADYIKKRGMARSWRGWRFSTGPARRKAGLC